jgi:hypothetical protein
MARDGEFRHNAGKGGTEKMGDIRQPAPVKYFCGILHTPDILMEPVRTGLEELLGPIDGEFGPLPFDFTRYYEAEMGPSLVRRFYSFEALRTPADLAGIKRATNRLEETLATAGRSAVSRPVNLDPGYIELAKLILASTKNYFHRIHIGQGIYAELTLIYQQRRWKTLPWTFPDYASGAYWPFFTQVRRVLHRRLQAAGADPLGVTEV